MAIGVPMKKFTAPAKNLNEIKVCQTRGKNAKY